MTTLHTTSDLTTEDLHAAVDHFIKRLEEILAESDAVKAQLKRVQHHVISVDAVNQAQAREIDALKLELHRRDTANAKLATRCSAQQELIDRLQQQLSHANHQIEQRQRWRPWQRIGNSL